MPLTPEAPSSPGANGLLLKVRDLRTYFFTHRGIVQAVDGVNFDLSQGECLCLVGESGCGKTATALSILRLIDPPGRIVSGNVLFHGEDLLSCTPERIREIRGKEIAMIFQDPQSSLNPVLTVGEQIEEQITLHLRLRGRQAREKALQLMREVGIPSPEGRIEEYPHQFSGGMKQRIMIAMALSCEPEIIIADEPTTALDVTIKAQILDILRDLKGKRRASSLLFITHDLGTVAEIGDRIVVMYGGKVAEVGKAESIFDLPLHPYTAGLLQCLPDASQGKKRLTPIPGTIPSLINPPSGCIFHTRCGYVMQICREVIPPEVEMEPGHNVVCHLYPERGLKKL